MIFVQWINSFSVELLELWEATCFAILVFISACECSSTSDLCHFVCSNGATGRVGWTAPGVLHDEDGVDVSGGWRGH